ncbi:MAG: urate hydroxylase PuuD [Gammaproteobacteria bacterium]|uniref:Urate hydroxylase PuuD n=1 Tax=Candidatus Thiopontia autotrophica TaxID=2841688 RepID=A0A8J6PCS2_9GAMM|nr:urate hydroxylase PuuD [Candidatus Thiopontia autotrophica]
MNPLKTRIGTVVAGIALALVLVVLLKTPNSEGVIVYAVNALEINVWLHAIVGITWIGLLYYFNAIQVPGVGEALADGDPGPAAINKYIAPRALFWFRWAAVLTWITGVGALQHMGGLVGAFTMSEGWQVIGMGAWLGTIMLFNVWFLIWPNQQKILGMKEATADEIAKAKVVALMASRTNTLLSFPMLIGMTGFGHGLPF